MVVRLVAMMVDLKAAHSAVLTAARLADMTVD